MRLMQPSLRWMLTVPFVALVLLTSGLIGFLGYRAGQDAVGDLSHQLVTETVTRIAQEVDRHTSASVAVLNAVATADAPAVSASLTPEVVAQLRERLWHATSIHRDPNNYAYLGTREGHFVGLLRKSEQEAELRLRVMGEGPRSIQDFTGIQGSLGTPVAETNVFEPRARPWFKLAQQADAKRQGDQWTPIYIDFRSGELVTTRVRPLRDAQGFVGAVATDLPLRQINALLARTALSPNALAMVVERDGHLIGVSRGAHLKTGATNAAAGSTHSSSQAPNNTALRLLASQSEDPLVAAAYAHAMQVLAKPSGGAVGDTTAAGSATPHWLRKGQASSFEDTKGREIELGLTRLNDEAGMDWLVIVAVPRQDFLQRIQANLHNTALWVLACALAALLLGGWVLRAMGRELRRLGLAVSRVASGDYSNPVHSARKDELGQLARDVGDMQRRLSTDSLTGLANRDAVMQRLNLRIAHHQRSGDSANFALVFVDLNRFKHINDSYGHDVGDAVLKELAARLLKAVREKDSVARLAGDEFLVLLDSVDGPSGGAVAREHIEAALAQPLHTLHRQAQVGGGGQALDVIETGAACGLAVYPQDGQDAAALLRHADQDMYRRKRSTGPLGLAQPRAAQAA